MKGNTAMNALFFVFVFSSLLLEEHRVSCHAEKYGAGIAGFIWNGDILQV